MVSARLEPTSSTQPVRGMSASGNGSPRSRPNARFRRLPPRTYRTGLVVDLRTAEHQPGELAQRVRLFVGQPAAAEDPHRVGSVTGPGAASPSATRSSGGPASSRRSVRQRPRRAPAARPAAPRRPARRARSGPCRTARRGSPGTRVRATTARPPGASGWRRSPIPHCNAQYGQWVSVTPSRYPSYRRYPRPPHSRRRCLLSVVALAPAAAADLAHTAQHASPALHRRAARVTGRGGDLRPRAGRR